MANITFIMEQHLGHRAYYLNLRSFIEQEQRIHPRWVEVTYQDSRSVWQRLPMVPGGLRGPLVGRQQMIDGITGDHPEVLFFNTQVPAALIGRRLFRQPYVLSTDITPIQYDQMAELYGHQADHPGILRGLKYRLNQRVFQHAARILPWSSWAAESVINEYGVHPDKVAVIAPGVNLDTWKPAPQKRDAAPFRILFVGGDLERKGGLDVLAAFKALPPGTAELVLVTRSSIPETPGVKVIQNLLPNSPELIALYQSSDIFVLPSCAEAFGIAAVEASAAGLPMITTGLGGLKDIVLHETTGLIVQPGDRTGLVACLSRLVNDRNLRLTLGQAARARAECYFDARKNARRILQIVLESARN